MVIGAARGHLRDASALVRNRHGRPRERWNERAGARAERQRPLLDELENRGAGQRLGLRRDAEDRIDGHLAIGFAIGPAEGLLVDDLAVLHHEGHDSRHAAGIDILLQPSIDDAGARGVERARAAGAVREGRAKKHGQGDRCDSHTARIVP